MCVDLRTERLYEQVELVRGAGSRTSGGLCIMSLVAYLAGECESDRPQTASPFVRQFAIQLNDGSSTDLRQDLKPFAPRIIGTNDGRDLERAALVHKVITEEVWPRAERDGLVGQRDASRKAWVKRLFHCADHRDDTRPNVMARFHDFRTAHEQGKCLRLGMLAGDLLVSLVKKAPTRRWYWAKSLELLDRLCEVGSDPRRSRMVSHALAEDGGIRLLIKHWGHALPRAGPRE
jgi:hypothetical protein